MALVLIADDNKLIISILDNYCKKEGYDTALAYDGECALNIFNEVRPDIILLDVMMPKKDGFEVCREIRKISNVPIIMITARGEDFERIMGLDIGADDYIVKPFSPGEVVARIKAVLRRITFEEKTSNIFTYDNLTGNFSIIDNICMPAYLGKHSDGCAGRALKLLDAFGLGGIENEFPSSLSGGEQRRVSRKIVFL